MRKLTTRERALASVVGSLCYLGAILLWPWLILAIPVALVALLIFDATED